MTGQKITLNSLAAMEVQTAGYGRGERRLSRAWWSTW